MPADKVFICHLDNRLFGGVNCDDCDDVATCPYAYLETKEEVKYG